MMQKHWPALLFFSLVIFFGAHIPAYPRLSLLIVAGVTWFAYLQKDLKKTPKVYCWIFWVAVLLVVFTRIYPFLSGHPAPLGYDTGIYKFEFEKAFENLPGFSMGIHPGLFFVADFFHLLGVTSDFLMREGFIIVNIFLVFMVYAVAKEFGDKRAGVWAAVVFALSSIQFNAYTYVLYKNALGLSVLLLSLILIKRRSYLLLPVGVFLAMLQPTHFLLLGLTLFILWVLRFRNRKDNMFLLMNGAIMAAGAFLVFRLNPDLVHSALELLRRNDPLHEGVFLQMTQGMGFISVYLPFAIAGLFYLSKKSFRNSLTIIALVTTAIIMFRLFFFRRYLIEFDIFAVIFSGIGIAHLIPKIIHKTHLKIIFSGILALFLIVHLAEVLRYRPLIQANELQKIQELCSTTEKDAIIMPTHSFYSPWVRGFSCRETFAPGLFERNTWDRDTWGIFWSGTSEERIKLMEETFARQPVYVLIGSFQPLLDLSGHERFTRLNEYIWKWQ